MKDAGKPGGKVSSQPEQWDLFTLISIFHDHFDTVFSKPTHSHGPLGNDFNQNPRAKAQLINIKDIRNKRAHDGPMTPREVYRLADLAQLFFDATTYKQIVD